MRLLLPNWQLPKHHIFLLQQLRSMPIQLHSLHLANKLHRLPALPVLLQRPVPPILPPHHLPLPNHPGLPTLRHKLLILHRIPVLPLHKQHLATVLPLQRTMHCDLPLRQTPNKKQHLLMGQPPLHQLHLELLWQLLHAMQLLHPNPHPHKLHLQLQLPNHLLPLHQLLLLKMLRQLPIMLPLVRLRLLPMPTRLRIFLRLVPHLLSELLHTGYRREVHTLSLGM